METIKSYKCPCCNAPLIFDAASQMLMCNSCDNTFEVSAVQEITDGEAAAKGESKYDWDSYEPRSYNDTEKVCLSGYSCPSCGAEITGDDTLGSTICPYCGQSAIVKRQFEGTLRPDYIIPFSVDKKSATKVFEDDDGIMLYICRDTREYHLTTHAKGLEYFNSNGLAYIESKILPYLMEDNYFDAFDAYINSAEELLEMAAYGNPYNEKHHSLDDVIILVLVCVFAPLIIAFRMMKSKLKKMKTATENNYAENYIKRGSKRIETTKDTFLYSNIIKSARTKSSSGTHTSSSG